MPFLCWFCNQVIYTLQTESRSDTEPAPNLPMGVGITTTFGATSDDKAGAPLSSQSSFFSDKWIRHVCDLIEGKSLYSYWP